MSLTEPVYDRQGDSAQKTHRVCSCKGDEDGLPWRLKRSHSPVTRDACHTEGDSKANAPKARYQEEPYQENRQERYDQQPQQVRGVRTGPSVSGLILSNLDRLALGAEPVNQRPEGREIYEEDKLRS